MREKCEINQVYDMKFQEFLKPLPDGSNFRIKKSNNLRKEGKQSQTTRISTQPGKICFFSRISSFTKSRYQYSTQINDFQRILQMKINILRAKVPKKSQVLKPTTFGIPLKCELETQGIQAEQQIGFSQRKNKIKWNPTQNWRYMNFLKKNAVLFDLSSEGKKKARVNVKMSVAVKTKTPSQCHSHHQKMMLKYGSLEEIIQSSLPIDQRQEEKKTLNFCQASESQSVQAIPMDQGIYCENLNEQQWFGYFQSCVFQKSVTFLEQ